MVVDVGALFFSFGELWVADKVTETSLIASYSELASLCETISCNKVRFEIFSSSDVY